MVYFVLTPTFIVLQNYQSTWF